MNGLRPLSYCMLREEESLPPFFLVLDVLFLCYLFFHVMLQQEGPHQMAVLGIALTAYKTIHQINIYSL
jgi:hypothetical protein